MTRAINRSMYITKGEAEFHVQQTLCLTAGQPFTYSFYVGYIANQTSASGPAGPLCRVNFVSTLTKLVTNHQVCGADYNPSMNNYGTCTYAGSGAGGQTVYERLSGTWTPNSDVETMHFYLHCFDLGGGEANTPLLFDLMEVLPGDQTIVN